MITVAEILEVTGGRAFGVDPAAVFPTMVADSRQVAPGALFCALRGERTDGHLYAVDAMASGAGAVLVDEWTTVSPRIEVVDVRRALLAILAARRRITGGHVVAVTGSVGKTTTKEFIAALLSRVGPTYRSPGNMNSDVGLPMASAEWDPAASFAVLEVAMRFPGEIHALGRAIRPDVAVVTVIGESHIGLLGSRDAIARAKAELLGALPASGVAVLNHDDPWTSLMRLFAPARVITVGGDAGADVVVGCLEDRGLGGWRLEVAPRGKTSFDVEVVWPGQGGRMAAGLAIGAALALGVDVPAAAEALSGLQPGEGRVRVYHHGDVVIIDDSYNAAPVSMEAALELLSRTPAGRRVAVLGDMRELGAESAALHRRIGQAAARTTDILVTVGEEARLIAAGAVAAGMAPYRVLEEGEAEDALDVLRRILEPGDVVLVKASRALGLERVVKGMKAT